MRVAIATFGDEVSPRFCFARAVIVVDIEDGRATARGTVDLTASDYPNRLRVLEERGVSLLVCGGFDLAHLPRAEHQGLHVACGIGGTIDDTVARLCAGRLSRHPHCWCHPPAQPREGAPHEPRRRHRL